MILVTDNNIALGQKVNKILVTQHADVVRFESSNALMRWLDSASPPPKRVKIVILGLLMPEVKNGTLCHFLREHPLTANASLILTSPQDSIDHRVKAHLFGASDFIFHPILANDLLIRVAVQIELQQFNEQAKTNKNKRPQAKPDEKGTPESLDQMAQILGSSQERLLQSEKMAATGRLVASLAHEINNPLQAIHSSLQLATHFKLPPEKQAEYLGMANHEVERVITLVTRILDFARPSTAKPAEADINAVLEQVMELTHKHTMHGKWQITTNLATNLPKAHIIPDQIAQVFLNIILNSFDAMPQGGQLIIETGARPDMILISFHDQGIGMTAETQKHLFEPFYSTKANASGLGLTISYGIIERHNGQIQIETVLNEGTIVHILLPCLSHNIYD